jgi:hypothetical protein
MKAELKARRPGHCIGWHFISRREYVAIGIVELGYCLSSVCHAGCEPRFDASTFLFALGETPCHPVSVASPNRLSTNSLYGPQIIHGGNKSRLVVYGEFENLQTAGNAKLSFFR